MNWFNSNVASMISGMQSVDQAILTWLVAHRSAALTDLSMALMRLGLSPVAIGMGVLAAAAVAATRHRFRPLVAAGTAAAIALAVSLALKLIIARPRPPAGAALVHAAGYSMPSTDSAVVAAICSAVVASICWRTWRRRASAAGVAMAVSGLVSFALAYLGVHWATDIVAGLLLGGLIGTLSGLLARSLNRPANRADRSRRLHGAPANHTAQDGADIPAVLAERADARPGHSARNSRARPS